MEKFILKTKDFIKMMGDSSIKDYDFYWDCAIKEFCLFNRVTKRIYFLRENFFEKMMRKLTNLLFR